MRTEEIQHRALGCHVANRLAQDFWRQTGEVQETVGARRVAENPG